MQYEVNMRLVISDDAHPEEIEELKKAVDHHIERLVDIDEWPCIETIYGCSIVRIEVDTDKED